ncbi:MAG: hypothetical protein ACKO3G_09335 [Planctomycetaceae bacterium]
MPRRSLAPGIRVALAASVWAMLAPAWAAVAQEAVPLPPVADPVLAFPEEPAPAGRPVQAIVPQTPVPANPLPAPPPAATVPGPAVVQPLPAPASTPLLPGLPPGVPRLDPLAPLPPGTVIGPGGPVVPGPPPQPANSVVIPALDAEIVWQQMVDTMDDFFKIQSEQRVVFSGGIPAEGRIETYPQTGATLLEPWRGDSVGFRERLESTLQSIRRSASMRLIPDPAGWRIEAVVLKELENLPRPMRATAGGASFRNDDSLYRYGTPLPTLGQQVGDQPRPVANPTPNLGWIALGRDPLLEKKMLGKVLGRLGIAPLPQAGPSYQAADPAVGPPPTLPGPALPPGPTYGLPVPREQLPPGAVVAPGPPVPIESLPVPQGR